DIGLPDRVTIAVGELLDHMGYVRRSAAVDDACHASRHRVHVAEQRAYVEVVARRGTVEVAIGHGRDHLTPLRNGLAESRSWIVHPWLPSRPSTGRCSHPRRCRPDITSCVMYLCDTSDHESRAPAVDHVVAARPFDRLRA